MVELDDLHGPMEVDDGSALPRVPKPLADGDMVPLGFDNNPGFLGRHPTYRYLRALEIPEGRVQCHLALWTKGVQDLGPWDRIPSTRRTAA